MPNLEPTYLRYIYDGLIKGSIHPENAAELPDGLIGMYEEAFDERTSVLDRQKLLQRFAIWALLKKDVSAAFVAEVLGESEDDIQEFISTYSAWFNSPESGKYQLYHERLKVYLLQKLSEGEVHLLHEKLITRLERAIEEQKADEYEWYGLEFLGFHLCVQARENVELYSNKLNQLSENESFKTRQYLMSASFEWNYNLLDVVKDFFHSINDYDRALQIEIQFATIYFKEKNSFSDLIEFIKNEQLQNFAKRFYALKGSSKDEIENFFYMTVLLICEIIEYEFSSEDSKVEFLKTAINVFDNSVPVDLALFDWEQIIAPKHIIQIIEVLSLYNLDTPLRIRTKLNLDEWKKKQEDKLESNAKHNIKLAEALPDLVIPSNLNKKKSLLIKIKYLEKLIDNNFIEESKDFFKSLRIEIDSLGDSLFRKSIYASKQEGFGIHEVRDSLFYYRLALKELKLEFFDVSELLYLASFFNKLNQKQRQECCIELLHRFVFENDGKIARNQNDKDQLRSFLLDLIADCNRLSYLDIVHINSVFVSLISVGESERAIELLKFQTFDRDLTTDSGFGGGDLWRLNIYSVITKALLEEDQIIEAIKLLNDQPISEYKDLIRKTISKFFLEKGDYQSAVFYCKQISVHSKVYFRYLTENIDLKHLGILITEWLKFFKQENYSIDIVQLIEAKNLKESFFSLIKENDNIWKYVYVILILNKVHKISDEDALSKLKSIISEIQFIDVKVNFCMEIIEALCFFDKPQLILFFASEIDKHKNYLSINSEFHFSSRDIISDLKTNVILNIDLYHPYLLSLKAKLLLILLKLNFYRPLNVLIGKGIGWVLESIMNSFFEFFRIVFLFIRIFLFPGILSNFKKQRSVKEIYTQLKTSNLTKSYKMFIQSAQKFGYKEAEGTNYFMSYYQSSISKSRNIDFSQIIGYPKLFWSLNSKRNFLLNYLSINSKFKRDNTYLNNLKAISGPSFFTVESLVKTSFYFKSEKNFRFTLVYHYAIIQKLTSGDDIELDQIMNLELYKKIFYSLT